MSLFLFQFFSEAYGDHALNEGQRAFDGNTLLMKEIIDYEKQSKVELSTVKMWVKVYDVSGMKQAIGFTKYLPCHCQVGNFAGIDEENFIRNKLLNFGDDYLL